MLARSLFAIALVFAAVSLHQFSPMFTARVSNFFKEKSLGNNPSVDQKLPINAGVKRASVQQHNGGESLAETNTMRTICEDGTSKDCIGRDMSPPDGDSKEVVSTKENCKGNCKFTLTDTEGRKDLDKKAGTGQCWMNSDPCKAQQTGKLQTCSDLLIKLGHLKQGPFTSSDDQKVPFVPTTVADPSTMTAVNLKQQMKSMVFDGPMALIQQYGYAWCKTGSAWCSFTAAYAHGGTGIDKDAAMMPTPVWIGGMAYPAGGCWYYSELRTGESKRRPLYKGTTQTNDKATYNSGEPLIAKDGTETPLASICDPSSLL